MIPSVLTSQIRRGVEDFLQTTFPPSNRFFHGLLDRLIAKEGGLFRGPYLSVKLPFRQGVVGPNYFPELPFEFPPFLHQEQAFARLSGNQAKSTVISTGTGSGKTESFLYPILDYCRQHQGQGVHPRRGSGFLEKASGAKIRGDAAQDGIFRQHHR